MNKHNDFKTIQCQIKKPVILCRTKKTNAITNLTQT